MIRNKFVIATLILAFLLGFLLGAFVVFDKYEQNTFQMDKFVKTCNNYYGLQNWTIIKDASGKYTCTGTGSAPTNITLIDWSQLK